MISSDKEDLIWFHLTVSVQAFIPEFVSLKSSNKNTPTSFRSILLKMSNESPERKQTVKFLEKRLKNRYFGIRHGQSEANVKEIISSDPQTASSYPLTDCGRNQAEGNGCIYDQVW